MVDRNEADRVEASTTVAGTAQLGGTGQVAGPQPRVIRRLLVANRGEIARRVIRTAHAMGIQTVAVHSDPDAGAPFVAEAMYSVSLGGRTSAQSYLDAGRVLDAAKRSGADAIHPGYGFLAESPGFAQAVLDAGLTWVGPTPEQMRAMALKVESKRLVAAAGVPLVPGAELAADADARAILAAGEAVGLPLLVKASAGGGGKGMRLVRDIDQLVEQVEAAQNEAASAFGDPTVFLERFLERGRHVEVQVFGDHLGNVVHLFERECSIQRRHQKIVEESPSPGATSATLERMYAAAVAVARAIEYHGAGTVEFMVAGSGESQEFYFLEMNTRLQVEHPVTESVTGLDLVEWQLRVARGERLPLAQEQIVCSGHAIEVRLYAEDPANGYLPNTGTIEWFDSAARPGIRVDSGVETGTEVSAFYDPMLAKVIGAGASREEAARVLADCLDGFEVAGVTTNRESLAAILRSPAFLAGDTTTQFLAENEAVLAPIVAAPEAARYLAAAGLGLAALESQGAPWASLAPLGWRNVPALAEVRRFAVPEAGQSVVMAVSIRRDRAGTTVEVGEAGPAAGVLPDFGAGAGGDPVGPVTLHVGGQGLVGDLLRLELDGIASTFRIRRAGEWVIVSGPERAMLLRPVPLFSDAAGQGADHGPATPVPGTITGVPVAVGDVVAVGDTLVVLEAMKMEHRIRADIDGRVAELRVSVGDSVDAHQIVAVLEPA